MQRLLRSADVRPLLDQLRGHAQRKIYRQPQVFEHEGLAWLLLAGIAPEQRRQKIAVLLQGLAQRRQRRLDLRQRRLLRRHIAAVGIAGFQLTP